MNNAPIDADVGNPPDACSLTAAANSAHRLAVGSLIALFALCVAWEGLLAPLRPGGSWLILKALPLLWPIYVVLRRPNQRRYIYQLASLLIWSYFTEGVVRAWSDLDLTSRVLAGIETALCCAFFVAAVRFVRSTGLHRRRGG
jgi:uncharacterized membrane protein